VSPRSLLALGIITLAAITAALVYTGTRGLEGESGSALLVPGLRDIVNDIEAIDIETGSAQPVARLRRDEESWRVENKDGYEADFRRIHDLLRDLAEASRLEPKTSNPEWYPRLGLSDIESASARGVQVSFPGTDLPAVILGDQDGITEGRYVRLGSQQQSWLTDRELAVPREASGWLERSVMDIPADELAEVTIIHPNGDRVRLKAADGEDRQWVLLDIPDGREAAAAWEIRPVANGLANVVLQDVRRHESVPEDAVRALYVTRDGLNFVVDLFVEAGQAWARFTVSAEPQLLMAEDQDASEQDNQLLADAAAVDARLSPWQFALPEAKFETMTRRLTDLLAEMAPEQSP